VDLPTIFWISSGAKFFNGFPDEGVRIIPGFFDVRHVISIP
jgi:hypothetical protein